MWYSSCWSHSTQEAFQAALQAVLDSSSSRSEDGTAQQPQFSDRVLQLLQHWQQHPGVSLEQSRSSWIARVDHDQSQAPVGGFTREQDRLALLRYLCTGVLQMGLVCVCVRVCVERQSKAGVCVLHQSPWEGECLLGVHKPSGPGNVCLLVHGCVCVCVPRVWCATTADVGCIGARSQLQCRASRVPTHWEVRLDDLHCCCAAAGELLTADVGSTVMCSLPEGFGTLASNENFFTVCCAWVLRAFLSSRTPAP